MNVPYSRAGARCILLTTLSALLMAVCPSDPSFAQETPPPVCKVDFRFQPAEWQTAICLADDWQKTLVDKSGDLLYDFPGPFGDFGTRIRAGFADGDTEWVSQTIENGRTPIVTTLLRKGPLDLELCAFAVAGEVAKSLVPPDPGLFKAYEGRGIEALGAHAPQRGWAAPDSWIDPVFRDVDVGYSHPLRYRFAAQPDKDYWVVFGFCEGWWSEEGQRVLDLKLEGRTVKTVDTVKKTGKNTAFVAGIEASDTNRDGYIDIEVAAAPSSRDTNAVLNVLWVFEQRPANAAVLSGAATRSACAYMPCGGTLPVPSGAPRADLMRVTIRNRGAAAADTAARIAISSVCSLDYDDATGVALLRGVPFVTVSHKAAGTLRGKTLFVDAVPERLEPGAMVSFIVAAHRNAAAHEWSVQEAEAALASSRAYWQTANIPFGAVTVPDANIQALFDASIRNIWQAREIKEGLPAFQVGPTCYRGLWIVDGAFLLEAAAMLGAGDQARAGIAYTLAKQKETGAFEVLSPTYYKENGIVLWTCVRHARLTQDKEWLASVWPRLEKTVAYIQTLRQRSGENPDWLCKGLIPPGDIDGGLSGPQLGEYTNVYWNLLGLKAAIGAARWLGKDGEADAWQREYDDFYGVFRKTAEKDMRQDPFGNRYLPTIMGNIGNELPQRAQWAFCHAVYPGQLFEKGDPLVAGNLGMLAATEQEGMVYGTGWAAKGFWNYFASFYGHAWLWQGNGQKAGQALYAYANHAAPMLDWREEQTPKGTPFEKVGDMPHNWASAEFIRLVTHLLALDRGNELHLLEGMPAAWAGPGMTTALRGVATPFGPLTFTLSTAEDGKQALLNVQPMRDASCAKIVVHLDQWTGENTDKVLELDPKQETTLVITVTKRPV